MQSPQLHQVITMINMLKETFVVDDDVEGLNIISSKFKNRKVGKKKNDEESSLEEERQKKKKMLEEVGRVPVTCQPVPDV